MTKIIGSFQTRIHNKRIYLPSEVLLKLNISNNDIVDCEVVNENNEVFLKIKQKRRVQYA